MLITTEFKETTMQTPEWAAWLRQLKIEGRNEAIKKIESGEIPENYLTHLRFFTIYQRNIHDLLIS